MSTKIAVVTLNCFDIPLSLNRKSKIKKIVAQIIALRPKVVFLQEIIFAKTTKYLDSIFQKEDYQSVDVLIKQKKITLINTHLTYIYDEKSTKQQEAQQTQLNQLLASLKTKSNIIVGGDFNFTPSSLLYKKWLESSKLVDSLFNSPAITISNDNTNKKGFYKKTTQLRLDYIFISANLAKHAKGRVIFDKLFTIEGKKTHLSDHFAVATTCVV